MTHTSLLAALRTFVLVTLGTVTPAGAQITIDDFSSGPLSTQLWYLASPDHLGMVKANGRLEFRTSADPQAAPREARYCSAHLLPAMSAMSEFKLNAKMNYQRQGQVADDVSDAMAESGLFMWFSGVDTNGEFNTNADGVPPGLLIAYGSFVRNGVDYRSFTVSDINDQGTETRTFAFAGSGSVLFNRFTDGQHGPAFLSIPPGQPLRVSVAHSVDAQMRRKATLTLNGSIVLNLLDEPADDLRPVKCSFGGYTRGPVKPRTGAKAWFDDVILATGSLTYAPPDAAASQGSSSAHVKLTWTAAPGSTGYRVYRLPNLAAPIGVTTATTFNDTQAPIGVATQYLVSSMSSAGESERTLAEGWRAPAAPTTLTASDGTASNGVQLSWSSVAGATQYVISRKQGTAGAIELGLATAPAYLDATGIPGVTYQYAVRARTAAGDGASGPADSGWRGLSAPTSVFATDGALLDRVRVSWVSVAGATGYKVLRSTGSTTPTVLTTLGPSATTFDDTTAVVGTVYQYAVRAVCAQGDGPTSASDAGSRASLIAPTANASDGAFTDKVRVTWGTVPGATGFKVLRTQGAGTPTVIATLGTVLTHDDTTAAPGVAYTYSVRAFNTQGDGPVSAVDAGWRAPAALPSVFASDGTFTNKVQLVWYPASGGTFTYKVLRGIGSGTPAVIGSVSTTNFDDTSAVVGTVYNYSIRVSSPAGDGPPCTVDPGWRAPVAPSTVNASFGTFTNKVRVTWSPVAGVGGYKVIRSEGTAPAIVLASLASTETTYDDATASIGVVYNYAVRSMSAAGDGPASANNTGWRAPQSPASVFATDGAHTDRVEVSWTLVNGATAYKILRAQGDATPAVIGTVASAATSFSDFTASVGVSYTYAVRASSAAGDSALSAPEAGWRAPAAPDTVSASSGTFDDKVRVVWSPVPGVPGYKVLRSSNSGPASVVASVGSTEFAFNDVQATVGVLYTYTVRSSTPLGEGPESSKVTGWRSPPAPQNLTATDGAQPDRVQLGWNPVPQGLGYAVMRAHGDGEFTQIGTASVGVFLDQSAVPGLIYRYAVRTLSALGPGVPSAEDTGWREMSAPTDLVATDDLPSTIELSWTAEPGGVSFEIYRTDIINEGPEELISTIPAAGLRFFEDTSAQPGMLYSYRVRTIGEPGTSASGFSDADFGSLLNDQTLVGGTGARGHGKGYEPDATDETPNGASDATMGIQRYLEMRELEGEPTVDCDAVADSEAVSEADPAEQPSPPESRRFIDLDLNGEPDLCQLRRGDLDLSGEIDAGDIAVLLTQIGEMPALGIGDLDGDGSIGPADLQCLVCRMPPVTEP